MNFLREGKQKWSQVKEEESQFLWVVYQLLKKQNLQDSRLHFLHCCLYPVFCFKYYLINNNPN